MVDASLPAVTVTLPEVAVRLALVAAVVDASLPAVTVTLPVVAAMVVSREDTSEVAPMPASMLTLLPATAVNAPLVAVQLTLLKAVPTISLELEMTRRLLVASAVNTPGVVNVMLVAL